MAEDGKMLVKKFSFESENLVKTFSFVVLIVLMLYFSIAAKNFYKLTNMYILINQIAVVGIGAIGMTMVILMGCIDLSVGSNQALAAVVCVALLKNLKFSPGPTALAAVLVTIAIATGFGLLMGVIHAYGRIPSFITTLGGMSVGRGLVMLITGGMPWWFSNSYVMGISTTFVLGLPLLAYLLAAFFFVFTIVMACTPFGRSIYVIGGNENVAFSSGILIKKTKVKVFGLCGFLVAISGIIVASRVGASTPTLGTGFEFDAITAVVLGGTFLTGGLGSVWGTLLGALIIGVLNNGLNLMGVHVYFQMVIKGIVLISAVLISMERSKVGIIK